MVGSAPSAASWLSPRARGASGFERILCPAESSPEAALAGVEPIPLRHLSEAVAYLSGRSRPPPYVPRDGDRPRVRAPDLADVRGQERARRALELAAAGRHNLLLAGPPGTGKTMLARRLPGILPPLSRDAALEVTRIHSVAGVLDRTRHIDRASRPFAPRTTARRWRRSSVAGEAHARARRALPITAFCCSTSSRNSSAWCSRPSGSRSRTGRSASRVLRARRRFPLASGSSPP